MRLIYFWLLFLISVRYLAVVFLVFSEQHWTFEGWLLKFSNLKFKVLFKALCLTFKEKKHAQKKNM